MAKVKKRTSVTGVRNVKASKKAKENKKAKADRKAKVGRKAATPKSKPTRKATVTTRSKSMSSVKSISKARAKGAKTRAAAAPPVVRIVVKPLEPQAKCGAGTSVQYLFRVDETVDGRTTTHLVFYDRHGWYCEHGRNCPAVGHAKKYQGHMARAS